VTLYGFDQNMFKIKNSYFGRKKLVEVDSQIPVYSEFTADTPLFRQTVRQNFQTFSDQDCILFDYGHCVQFANK